MHALPPPSLPPSSSATWTIRREDGREGERREGGREGGEGLCNGMFLLRPFRAISVPNVNKVQRNIFTEIGTYISHGNSSTLAARIEGNESEGEREKKRRRKRKKKKGKRAHVTPSSLLPLLLQRLLPRHFFLLFLVRCCSFASSRSFSSRSFSSSSPSNSLGPAAPSSLHN